MADLLLQVKDVSKTFPGVKALDHVNLQIGYGEVHGLIGENGAGKSTIIKIIAGIYEPDEGQVTFMGKTCQHESIRQSLSRGISVIYQELCLVPHMKVYENIMLGYEGLKHGGYSAEKARARAAAILEQLGLELPLDAYVRDLDIAVQQMIEIAKAFSRDVKLIIMDEPTSSLTNKEVDQLYKIIRNLKREGISTLFVSHKLEEIEEICDCLTVFRDGKTITSAKVGEITPDEMVYAMVGREITNYYTTIHKPQSEVVMELKGLGKAGVIEDVSFALHKGEVLGMTGLIGAAARKRRICCLALIRLKQANCFWKEKVCASSPRMMPWPQAWPSFRKTARNRALFPRWAWASISPSAYWSSSCISRVWTTQRKTA